MSDVLAALSVRADKYSWTVRRRYMALEPEVKSRVDRLYRRHVRACESAGIQPDGTNWIAEAIEEASSEQRTVNSEQ